jgi:hypothetical protein
VTGLSPVIAKAARPLKDKPTDDTDPPPELGNVDTFTCLVALPSAESDISIKSSLAGFVFTG